MHGALHVRMVKQLLCCVTDINPKTTTHTANKSKTPANNNSYLAEHYRAVFDLKETQMRTETKTYLLWLTSACAASICVMIPLWSSRLSFTIGICALAELISWCSRWFSTSACASFSLAWSSLSLSSSSCLLSSVTSLMQASCSGRGKIKYKKNEIKRLTHCSDYQTQHDASVATDLSGQPRRALVASTERYCQLHSPKFPSSVFLCGELPLHTAYQPPAAQSDTWPLQGHHLFSSKVALMDNFLVDEELYKSFTVYYSVLWLLKQWQCVPIIIPVHSWQVGVLLSHPLNWLRCLQWTTLSSSLIQSLSLWPETCI